MIDPPPSRCTARARPGLARSALLVLTAVASVGLAAARPASGIEWEPGNGLLLPGGLWLAGDVTAGVEVPEHGPAAGGVDDVSLLARWEPSPRVSFFAEVRMEDLVEVVEGEGFLTGQAAFAIERLYAEVLLAPPLTIRLGKVFTPFGLWNVTHRAPFSWTTDEPAVVAGMFPTRTTGVNLIYRTTWHGWSLDATTYGPAQDELLLRAADADEREQKGWLAGTRIAAGREIGPAFATLGLNAAGFRHRDRSRWTTASALDLEIDVGGHHVTGELTFRVPQAPGRTTYGFYAQDVVSLAPLGRLAKDLHAVVRLEQFQPPLGRSSVGGLVGLFWRPVPYLVLRSDYLVASRRLDNLSNPDCMRRSPYSSEARLGLRGAAVAALLAVVHPLLGGAEPSATRTIAIVVGKESGIERVTVDTLRELYLRRQRLWPGGARAVPVNLPPDSRLRSTFSMRVLGRRPEDLVGYWRRTYFDGILPPLVLKTPAAVCAYVAAEPGAIGYVAPEDVDGTSCRVLAVLPDGPG